MPDALTALRPTMSRNELGWLATLDDVESRIVFVDRGGDHTRYRAESGPFDVDYLRSLPKRDWTLLVHDVEKHVPAMRALFNHVPFISDWRIDDLMVSFAAPGGGVGPHRDNYDVFLCQGVGVRDWRFSVNDICDDPSASDDLALLAPFDGDESHTASAGDVLYLPPQVGHWGTAQRACITYSIGMRAPQISDFMVLNAGTTVDEESFYQDADLSLHEAIIGYISPAAIQRACQLVNSIDKANVARVLGRFVTQTKDWLTPDIVENEEVTKILQTHPALKVHGMTRLAYDDSNVYVNGSSRWVGVDLIPVFAGLCRERRLSRKIFNHLDKDPDHHGLFEWMIGQSAFDLDAIS